MPENENKFEDIVTEYKNRFALYEAFTESIATACSNLCRARSIIHIPFETRTKTLESFSGKIHRPDKQEKYNQIEDITDISGIRIIVYYEKDVAAIAAMIRENFCVDEINSTDKTKELAPDRFGYLSTHFIVPYGKERSKLEENSQFTGLKAEIQIRTVVQHAWATIDRHLRYNNEDDIPQELRRKLFRVSALLELADKEFSEIDASIAELRSIYEKNVKSGNLNIGINKDSLEAFLRNSEVVLNMESLAQEAGLFQYRDEERYSSGVGLPNVLKSLNIINVEELSSLLESYKESAKEQFDLFKKYRENVQKIRFELQVLLCVIILINAPKQKFEIAKPTNPIAIKSMDAVLKVRAEISKKK